MKALSLESPRHWRQIEITHPERPGPGNVLVRVHQVGICGTDISGYLGKMPFFSYPRIPGHELGVEVVEVGAGVENVGPGDRCSVEPYLNCQQCYACARGLTNCCEALQVLGVHCDGGLRPLFQVPARKLHVSQKLTFEQLALVETLAIGCHATNRAAVRPGECCLIIGAGPIGLATLEFVKLAGGRLIVLDTNEQRLDFCKRVMGVSHTLKLSNQVEKDLRNLTNGQLPDVVMDATGSSASMSSAFGLVTHGGRLIYVGITAEEVQFRPAIFHKCEGTLLCSRNAVPADFQRIIQLIENGQLDTGPWITHRTSFEELIDVFPSYTRPETGVIKAVVRVGD